MQVTPLLSAVNPSTFLRTYLEANGIDDVESYLHPHVGCFDSCWGYPNMLEAVELLEIAIKEKWKIGILQDSDLDGVVSAAIAYDFLRMQGVAPTVFFHVGKQHGLRPSKEENIIEQVLEENIQLLWIPDASSGDIEPCKQLKEAGVEIVITDHHLADDNPYATVVNCHLGEGLNFNLTGAGVTEKLVDAYCKKHNFSTPDYSDLVSLSLVGDVSDLTSLENRAYIAKANKEM